MKYIGVDPGISTGIAVIEIQTDYPPVLTHSITLMDTNWKTVWKELDSLVNDGYDYEAMVEDFHGGVGGKIQNTVNQIIGASLVTLSRDYGTVQSQENVKRTPWIDEARRILKTYYTGEVTPHQIDALAHALSIAKPERGLVWECDNNHGED
mgnify:CR=1 FL=1